jgi:hypothetical protein
MFVRSLVVIGSAWIAVAQEAPRGAISGALLDADTRQQISQTLRVSAVNDSGVVCSVDAKGEYTLSNLVPGTYEVQVQEPDNRIQIGNRLVTVNSNAVISRADVYVRLSGAVVGVITDSEKEPVQGAQVFLVTGEYWWGHLVYFAEQHTKADDLGGYRFSRSVRSGKTYLLLVLPPLERQGDRAASPEPNSATSPNARKRVMGATWYPGPPVSEEARFVLRSGEQKHVDLTIPTFPNYCLDGQLTFNGEPSALDYELAVKEISGYAPAMGGSRGTVRAGKADADGRFRVCGLWPGEFRLIAGMTANQFGYTSVSVADSDIYGITADARSPLTVTGEIKLDAVSPPPQEVHATVTLIPASRNKLKGEASWYSATVAVPGSFTFTAPAMTDYQFLVSGDGAVYTRRIFSDGADLVDRTLEARAGAGRVEIILGSDPATVRATVLDRDDKPVPDASVCLFPTAARNKEELSSSLLCTPTDAKTGTSTVRVPPGRYYAFVEPAGGPPDHIDFFWTHRSNAEATEVGSNESAQVTLRIKE